MEQILGGGSGSELTYFLILLVKFNISFRGLVGDWAPLQNVSISKFSTNCVQHPLSQAKDKLQEHKPSLQRGMETDKSVEEVCQVINLTKEKEWAFVLSQVNNQGSFSVSDANSVAG